MATNDRLSRPARWAVGFAIWTALGCFSVGQAALYLSNAHSPIHWGSLFVGRLTDWYSLAIFTPLLFWLARRFPADQPPRSRNILVLAAASVPIVVLKYAILVQTMHLISADNAGMTVRTALMRNLIVEVLCTWAIIGVIHAILFYRRLKTREIEAARLAKDLAEARLEALTLQLQPHFLFNTLNSVVTLIGKDAAAAEEMLISLGDMLHRALDERPVVSLASEVSLLHKYLDIMRRRFAQQLDVRVDVAADVEGVMVPRFMLQPIVENSLEHGIARREGAGTVEVRARRDGDSLVISVYDDGPGLPALDDVRGNGIGLRNTERRLAAMYGTRGSLVLGRAALGGTAVTITIPVS